MFSLQFLFNYNNVFIKIRQFWDDHKQFPRIQKVLYFKKWCVNNVSVGFPTGNRWNTHDNSGEFNYKVTTPKSVDRVRGTTKDSSIPWVY